MAGCQGFCDFFLRKSTKEGKTHTFPVGFTVHWQSKKKDKNQRTKKDIPYWVGNTLYLSQVFRMIHEDVYSFIGWHHLLSVFTPTFHLSYNLVTLYTGSPEQFLFQRGKNVSKIQPFDSVFWFSVHNSQGMANRWVTVFRGTHSLSSTAVCFAHTENQTLMYLWKTCPNLFLSLPNLICSASAALSLLV